MRRMTSPVVSGILLGLGVGLWLWLDRPADPARSPYGAQLQSPIRGLSAEEVADLRAGRGAGFARMAELNRYPGPRHAIDLADRLALDSIQRREAERIYRGMRDEAVRLGREILAREESLSQAFATRRVTTGDLVRETAELGALYGRLRAVHLRAHVELSALLSPEQVRRYDALRGYHGGAPHLHGS